MDQPTQYRFRPLIEKRLAALEEKLPHAPPERAEGAWGITPSAKDIRDEMARLNHALRRIDGGFYGRCIRCGRDLPVKRLEGELAALSCDPCPERTALPLRPIRRRTSLV